MVHSDRIPVNVITGPTFAKAGATVQRVATCFLFFIQALSFPGILCRNGP